MTGQYDDWNLGFLNIMDDRTTRNPNFTVIRVRRNLGHQSSVGIHFDPGKCPVRRGQLHGGRRLQAGQFQLSRQQEHCPLPLWAQVRDRGTGRRGPRIRRGVLLSQRLPESGRRFPADREELPRRRGIRPARGRKGIVCRGDIGSEAGTLGNPPDVLRSRTGLRDRSRKSTADATDRFHTPADPLPLRRRGFRDHSARLRVSDGRLPDSSRSLDSPGGIPVFSSSGTVRQCPEEESMVLQWLPVGILLHGRSDRYFARLRVQVGGAPLPRVRPRSQPGLAGRRRLHDQRLPDQCRISSSART